MQELLGVQSRQAPESWGQAQALCPTPPYGLRFLPGPSCLPTGWNFYAELTLQSPRSPHQRRTAE